MYPTKPLWQICTFVRWPFWWSLKKEIFKKSWYAVYEQMHAIWDQYEEIRYYIDEQKFSEMKRFELSSWNLIMSCSGTMWKVSIVQEQIKKWIINQALLMLKPNDKLLNKYLKVYMESWVFQDEISKYSKWAAIKNVASVKILKEIQIPLPQLSTQKLIVQKLDSSFENINKQIDLIKTNLSSLEELNKSVLESFWDFKKVLVWDIVEELFAWWDLPKDWRYSKEKTDEYNIPIFANAIKEDWLYWYTEKPRVIKSAITISARWTIWFTKLRLEPFYPIVRLLVLIPKKELADLKYLEYILNTINLKQFWSSIPQLSVPQLKSFQIPLPPLQKQKEIVSYLDEVFEKNKDLKTKYDEQLKELEELKQSLLKDAFEGKLVKE